MAKKKKKKYKVKVGRIILLLLFIALIIFGGNLFLEAKEMYDGARTAKHELEEMIPLIKEESYTSAQIKAKTVQGILKDIKARLEGPIWKHLDKLPKYGDDFVSGMKLLNIADRVLDDYLDRGFEILKENPLSKIKVDNSLNVVSAINYLNFVQEVLPDAESTIDEISSIHISLDKDNLIGTYCEKFKSLFELYHSAEKYIPLVRTILGNGEDRLYILAAQNSAEIRSAGGFPGSMGTIRIKDGYLSIGDFESVWDMLSFNLPFEDTITDQEYYMFYGWMQYPRDASFDPYFPRVAQIWADSYTARHSEHVDGIISMTPIIIQRILEITGPITLEDGTVLDGTNATKFIQSDIYLKYLNAEAIMYGMDEGDEISNTLFSSVASQTMSMVFENINLDTLPKFMDMFQKAVDDRIIMMWMDNAEGNEVIKSMGAAGDFNTDPENPKLGVYFNNGNPSKLGWYLDLDINVGEAYTIWDGSLCYPVSVTMRNTIDWPTVYYAGTYIAGELELGPLISYIYLVAPAGGYISDYWIDNWYAMNEDYYMGNHIVYARHFMIYPEDSVTVYFNVITAPGVTAPLGVEHTPTLQEYR